MNLKELIDEYREVYNVNCLEGISAVRKFAKFCGDLGYKSYLGQETDNIFEFLADNPGAIQALFDWVSDNSCQEWEENIEGCLPERELDE